MEGHHSPPLLTGSSFIFWAGDDAGTSSQWLQLTLPLLSSPPGTELLLHTFQGVRKQVSQKGVPLPKGLKNSLLDQFILLGWLHHLNIWFAKLFNWASVFLLKFAGLHRSFTFQYPTPVKNLSPSPVLYGANVNPHQSPQEFYTCESKFKQGKKKKGLRFLLREFYWNIPFMSLHTAERLDSVTAAFTPTHLLPYCYSYLFSGDLRNYPPLKKKPFTLRSMMMKIKKLQHSCTVTWIMLWSCLKIALRIWMLMFDHWVSSTSVPQGWCPCSPCRGTTFVYNT